MVNTLIEKKCSVLLNPCAGMDTKWYPLRRFWLIFNILLYVLRRPPVIVPAYGLKRFLIFIFRLFSKRINRIILPSPICLIKWSKSRSDAKMAGIRSIMLWIFSPNPGDIIAHIQHDFDVWLTLAVKYKQILKKLISDTLSGNSSYWVN